MGRCTPRWSELQSPCSLLMPGTPLVRSRFTTEIQKRGISSEHLIRVIFHHSCPRSGIQLNPPTLRPTLSSTGDGPIGFILLCRGRTFAGMSFNRRIPILPLPALSSAGDGSLSGVSQSTTRGRVLFLVSSAARHTARPTVVSLVLFKNSISSIQCTFF